MKENILGYDVNIATAEECADKIFHSVRAAERTWLACFNPHSYAMALKDKTFSRALESADWLVPDGSGVVLASRFLGGRITARVTGSDVFAGLHRRMNAEADMSVFFLGSTEGTLTLIRQRMAREYPRIRVTGVYSPPFKDVYSPTEINEMIDAVNAAAPDVLWVGMTAPKQEKFIFENRARLNVKFVAAVGAVFDFYAGNIRRDEDSWFVKNHLEWLPRLVQEPRRLWQRTFISAPIFVWMVMKQKAKTVK